MTLYTPTLQIVGISSETAAKIEVMALPAGRHMSLKAHGQTLVVLNGSAWVSLNGEDFILRRGESLTLKASPAAACVSAVGDKPVMLEVR